MIASRIYLLLVSLVFGLFLVSCQSSSVDRTNVGIIKSTYLGGSSKEAGKALQKYLADDAIWIEAKGFPYAGTYKGFEEIHKNVFTRLNSEWINYKFTPEEFVADNNIVVVYGTYEGTYTQTNKSFTARVSHIWKLKNGKIVRFEQIVDSQPVIEAMS